VAFVATGVVYPASWSEVKSCYASSYHSRSEYRHGSGGSGPTVNATNPQDMTVNEVADHLQAPQTIRTMSPTAAA
jgi:hypothetical protein